MQQYQMDVVDPGGDMTDPALEQIEQQALLNWHAAATRPAGAGLDWRLERVGDALCSVSGSEPSILLNRALTPGSGGAPTAAQLLAIRDIYAAAGVSRFFLHLPPERRSPEVSARLADAGYRRHRGWVKFTRGCRPVGTAETNLSVRQIHEQDAFEFAAIAASAFDLLPTTRAALAALVIARGWRLYMSFAGGRPAGTGAIFIDGDTGYLDWGATHPDFRRRGSQTALLHARLHHAFDAGCSRVVTMTGEAVPGDPQHSYRNILRAGFAERYCRENWIPSD
jgi:GNAT superfamily N-acetyltransferase